MPTIFYDWKSSKTGEYFHNKLVNNERTIVFPNKYLTDIFSCILQKNIVEFYVQFLILQKTTCGLKQRINRKYLDKMNQSEVS